ncbi:hypothetical protein UPYG_G00218890 [Umbra pygmaea]|uniref:Uncharacterized protein n=1 Tax=Umbra pygmaea TaxID=75934 RepID=A0ABD0X986_UMBPY
MSQGKPHKASGQRMLFTGPDGIGDYRARLIDSTRYTGVGPLSSEATGDLSYLCRPSPCQPPPMPRQSYVGEVGWGLKYHQQLNRETLLNNKQIKRTEFRSMLEDRVTHRYQNPWQALPHILDKQSVKAGGKLAWTHTKHNRYSQDNNQLFRVNTRFQLNEKKATDVTEMSDVHFPEIVQLKKRG